MKRLLLAVSLLAVLASPLTQADELDDLLVLNRPLPRNVSDLRVIEQVAMKVAAKVVPCTVGVQVGNNHGSGVVITESGYVLTAAHVTDRPGRNATIRFPDGKTVRGKTLGLHTEADGALIKITDEGTWPFAPFVTLDDYPYPKPGDWCIATGHPGGFDEDRTPPVRLGRIIDVNETVIRTDCTINSGDSGGPLFDMQGRVIGIHSRIAEQSTVNLHGPVLAFQESWKQMRDGEVYPPLPESRFLDKLDIDRDGKITRAELPEGPYLQLYDRLKEKYNLDAETEYTIRELKGLIGWRHIPPAFEIRAYDSESPSEHALARERFVRGREVKMAFESVVANIQKSIVEVRCDDKRVAYGTVVEGGVVTKASQLEAAITCRTHDGRTLTATVAHVDKENDLALLKIDEQLEATSLDAGDTVPLGCWLISPKLGSRPISVGVSSVPSRAIRGLPGVLGVQIDTDETRAMIVKVFPDSGAAAAGLQPKDVIVKVMSTEVSSLQEVQEILAKYRAGEIVSATVLRAGEPVDFKIRLGMREDIFVDDERMGSGRLNGELSWRRDDFPEAIQHDSVLQPQDCGGPVVTLDGVVAGINIARADRVATYALPSHVVRDILKKFNDAPLEKVE
ncbi:MAG: trypsin-like peptidase domain-containing protein [Planctomycetaceae bacterium]|nr:trypsin-like peptidase domain-containing protein [Planctomycetales bacterium]MCB9923986.1 trypsin-like peptidase domain-containing protein [Planctomycetaceae bacterium]